MKISALFFTLIFTSLLYGQKTTYKTITILPNMSFQNYEHFKKLTLNSLDSDVEHLNGFQFQWGYLYTLKVKETKLSSTLSDGTRYNYELVKVISKTKIADTSQFNLFLDGNLYYYKVDSSELASNQTLKPINDSTFLYLDEVEIEVPSYLLEAFRTIQAGNIKKLGTFIYINERRIRLIEL